MRYLTDALRGNPHKIDAMERDKVVKGIKKPEYTKFEVTQAATDVLPKKYLQVTRPFLAKNSKGVTTTVSGLQYEVVTLSKGPRPIESIRVPVHCTWKFISEVTFDSFVSRGIPVTFSLNRNVAS